MNSTEPRTPTPEPALDKWADWLLHTRFGGSRDSYDKTMEFLGGVRDKLLADAGVAEGHTILDVGCGDGLIGMKALEKVGESGKVIFSDISQSCLDHCHEFAPLKNSKFVVASADDLSAIPSESVDAVFHRSVIIYVQDKKKCFEEFYRVLKPGGKLAFFEPINSFTSQHRPKREPGSTMFGYDTTPINHIVKKIGEKQRSERPHEDESTDPMMNFDERDLLALLEDTGFDRITLEYKAEIGNASSNYDWLINAAPNPTVRPVAQIMQEVLTPEEQLAFEAYLRPVIETTTTKRHMASALVLAIK